MNAQPLPVGKPIRKDDPAPLPPHSVEAEEALLGSLLFMGDTVKLAISENLKPADFYVVSNAWLYEAILELYERGTDIDTVTVIERLKERGQLDEVGQGETRGAIYLTRLILPSGLGFNVRGYARIIIEKATRRRMLAEASALARDAYDETTDAEIQISRRKRALTSITPFNPNCEFVLGPEATGTHEAMLNDQAKNQVWHPVPWNSMVDRVPVIVDGDLIVICGPEGSGKSAMLANWAEFNAQNSIKTCYIHTEMNKKQVFDRRLVGQRKSIRFQRLQKPDELNDHEWEEITLAGVDMMEWLPNLDTWGCGLLEDHKLFSVMQRMVDDFGTRQFVIDYLNDIIPERERGSNEAAAWRDLLAKFENFNNQNGTVIITAAQLNAEGGAYQIGKALKQKAMLYLKLKPVKLEHEFNFEYDGIAYKYLAEDFHPVMPVYVEKYRGGGRGVFRLLFVGPRYQWVDVPPGFDNGEDDPGAYDDGVYRGGH